MTEEERAELYRTQLRSRRQARQERFVALAGDRDARVALDAAWAPPLLARLESEVDLDPCVDSLEEMYAEVPTEDIYLSAIPDGLLL